MLTYRNLSATTDKFIVIEYKMFTSIFKYFIISDRNPLSPLSLDYTRRNA